MGNKGPSRRAFLEVSPSSTEDEGLTVHTFTCMIVRLVHAAQVRAVSEGALADDLYGARQSYGCQGRLALEGAVANLLYRKASDDFGDCLTGSIAQILLHG